MTALDLGLSEVEEIGPKWRAILDQADMVEKACEHLRAGDERTHTAWHLGEPCPYLVAACLLRGDPDPRELVTEWTVVIDGVLDKGTPPLTLNKMPGNHFAKNKIVQAIKARVRNAVRDAEIPHLDRVHVQLHYRPRTNRHMDVDNLVATLKPAIDALHHADDRDSANLDSERRYQPIVDGDDPRFVTWRPPILHPALKGESSSMWLVLRSYGARVEEVEATR